MLQSSTLVNQYETYQIALVTLGTVYAAIFVKISNHYVFKPKIENFFLESIIASKTFFQLLVDFLTNLTQLTFIAFSILVMQSDDSLAVIVYSDMSWCGLLLSLVSFKAVLAKQEPNIHLLIAKNVTFLILVYLSIVFHYATPFYYISLPISLVLLYFLNLFLNSNQQKFIEIIQLLFGYKPDKEIQKEYQYKGYRNNPEFLSKHYPVTPQELAARMKTFQTQLKTIKLSTRKKLTQNLLKISLAVSMSREKQLLRGKKDIKNYYGNFNGTVLTKSRKLIQNQLCTKSTDEMLHKDSIRDYDSQEYENSALFYIFPVKMFESSKILSIFFSLLINLGLGVLISFAVDMASTLNKGYFLHIFYGFLLLPLRPSICKQDFLNSMALSSLWKYCLYGFFLTSVCLSSASTSTFSFAVADPQLIFVPSIQIIVIVASTHLIKKPFTSYIIFLVWLGSVVSCLLLIFKFS